MGTWKEAISKRWFVNTCVAALLAILFAELLLTASRDSMSVDEGNHIYSGYMMWKRADFGLNPEHPPLVKLLAALPLLAMDLKAPEPGSVYYKLDAYLGGREFLSGANKGVILFRARVMVSLLAVLLAALVFAATREMFGLGAGFLALVLAVFDPNLVGFGSLVTTDVGVSCFLLASIYCFYRYVKAPSLPRLLLAGLTTGLALTAKHNGMFVVPIQVLLVLSEFIRNWASKSGPRGNQWRASARLAGALVAVFAISLGVLWSMYGFRYSAREKGFALTPPLPVFTTPLKPYEAGAILTLARWKAVPESYLAGAADVRTVGEHYPSFILGAIHRHGVWFYFPIVLTIKCTEALLALMLIAAVAVVVRGLYRTREFLFLFVPLAFILAIAMAAHLNTGVRHIMPVYAFLWPLTAGAASTLLRGRWAIAMVVAALLHATSSLATFNSHIAYANAFWGGPDNVHNLLTDSNADWGQQLYAVKDYLEEHRIRKCWFAYIGEGIPTHASYWGIPCTPMPNLDGPMIPPMPVIPAEIDGPVLISADELSGY
ncbi:MAG TPA: glycosyltransferase family 39 protein, partial [Terracidiphilus sp.]|nr:glycosyltransferase family 39 protein [Terracidiphilus sp.]